MHPVQGFCNMLSGQRAKEFESTPGWGRANVLHLFMVSLHFWDPNLRNLIVVDPLIAKVMVHASGRHAAAQKMTRVLSEAKLQGPPTNLHFLRDVVSSKCKISRLYSK